MSKKHPSMREVEHRANQGDVKAAFQLYENYRDGSFVEQDEEKSAYYAAKALERFATQSLIIDSVKLVGFRAFVDIDVPLLSDGSNDKKLVVIVGINGAGKTSILDAISMCLSWLVLRIIRRSNSGSGKSPDKLDIHHDGEVLSEYASVVADFQINPDLGYTVNLSRSRDDSNRERKNDVKAIEQLGSLYKLANEKHPDFNMPLISYYSTERTAAWDGKKDTKKLLGEPGEVHNKFDAYEDTLDADVDFMVFFKWFKYQEELVKLESGTIQKQAKKSLLVISKVINCFMPDLSNLRVQRAPVLDLLVDKNDTPLSVRQLSQGEKSLFALVVDMAQRLVVLNPSLENPLAGSGIVLIDEIDLHLHPGWQQKVIPNLRNTFKNIQFIVTTHSQQVLTTVESGCIRILDNGKIYSAPPGSKGAESSRLLKQIFNVSVRPPNDENTILLNAYLDKVYDDQWSDEDVVAMRVKLNAIYAGEEPALDEADLFIENREWELKIEKSS